MPRKTDETKHQRFMRLANRRLERALTELRLVSQLSAGNNYEYHQDEAIELVSLLDQSVTGIAKAFSVPYSTAIGEAAHRAAASGHLTTTDKAGSVDEVDVAKAINLINLGENEKAKSLLKAALLQEAR